MVQPNNNIITEHALTFRGTISRYLVAITALLVAIIFGVGYFILMPQYQEVRVGGRNNLATRQAQKTDLQTQLQDLNLLLANYQKINQADIDRFAQILPTEKDVAGLFTQLQALADKQGFSLASVNLNQEPEKLGDKNSATNIKKLTLTLNLVGQGYPAFKTLLESIEYNIRLLDVNAVYFNPDTNNYTVNAFTYYFSPPK